MTHTKSIISNEPVCYRCGTPLTLERHHCINGNGRRGKAEAFGLWVYLCTECHVYGKHAVHRDREYDRHLHQVAQRAWEQKYGTRDEFIREFGKSWL